MIDEDAMLKRLAEEYLAALCLPAGRPPGAPNNRAATAHLARELEARGLRTETPEFDCLLWEAGGARLAVGGEQFAVLPSPFGLGVHAAGRLVVATTADELAAADLSGAIVLLRGDIAREQIMPKHYPFYNPEEHRRVVALLESKAPMAVVAAPARNPQSVGAIYPYPLFEDGDFAIPAAHSAAEEGLRLAARAGQETRIEIDARRWPGRACNVVARIGPDGARRLVVCAHIDSRGGTPGALDNGSGVAVLLLLAELLQGYRGPLGVELLAVNGEDYYAASGELDYLARNRGRMGDIALAVNLDAAGAHGGRTAWALYGVPEAPAAVARRELGRWPELMEGEPWYQSDHMVFAQNGVPAMSITSERFLEVQATLCHAPEDTPDKVDAAKLVQMARALRGLVEALSA